MSEFNDEFKFEFICPFCNTEFSTEVQAKTEITCPKCQNKIELDWNGGEENGCCSGHCSSCHNRCGGEN